MRPSPAAIAALALAACVSAGPAPTPAGSVEFLGETYPLEVLANGTWRARVDGTVVICARPYPTACYWSVRHYLVARELLDDLG
jgi:hypothetical protein